MTLQVTVKVTPKRQRNDTQDAKDDTNNGEYDTKNDTKKNKE